jgi:hypothetical protein
LLTVVIAHDKAGGLFFDGPRRREAALRHFPMLQTAVTSTIFLLASHALPKAIFWEATEPENLHKSFIFLARSERFELPTLRFEV